MMRREVTTEGEYPSVSVRAAVEGLDGPLGVIDLDAMNRNTKKMRERAGGLSIRVASKSLRVPAAVDHILAHDGFTGVLAYSLAEAVCLARERGIDDIVVGYPTAERGAIRELLEDELLLRTITLVADSPEQLQMIEAVRRTVSSRRAVDSPVRIALEFDAGTRIGPFQTGPSFLFGVRRSPLHTPEQAKDFAVHVVRRPGFRLVGILAYEAQIAGLPDRGVGLKGPLIRHLKVRSIADLAERRTRAVRAVREVAPLEFVNGGGTGSLELSEAEGSLTEIGAGSGFYSPVQFDYYTDFLHEPAAYFALPVVRRPAPGWCVVFQGGWTASGPIADDRLPVVSWPSDLELSATEGPGEVQTPLRGKSADRLRPGDFVFFRHVKAGEVAERLANFAVVSEGKVVDTWPTYRGLGWTF